jgi:hypothetical protein
MHMTRMTLPQRILSICLASLLLAGMAILIGCQIPAQRQQGKTSRHGAAHAQVTCPIDGAPSTESQDDRRPLAVMIENSPDARPQSGLTQACVVYEAITEGGITRFEAIYLHGNPAVIGPIRSARPHFINIAREYNAAYVHCGESYEALQILAADPTLHNLDQMVYAKPFWRDHTRRAPHNLYASTEKLRALMTKLAWEAPVSPLPVFTSDHRITGGQPATNIEIHFPGAVHYRLQWVYAPHLGGYLRYMDGILHVDRETGRPLVAKNVMIQRVHSSPFLDSTHGTYDVEMMGARDGQFFSHGEQEALIWAKSTINDITQFADTNRQPLPFQPGQTWVEVLPVDGTVSVR